MAFYQYAEYPEGGISKFNNIAKAGFADINGVDLPTYATIANTDSQVTNITSTSFTQTVSLSTANTGDLRIVFVGNTTASGSIVSATPEAGWTSVTAGVFYRFKEAGDSDTMDVSFSTGSAILAYCYTLTGVSTVNTVEYTASVYWNNGSSSTQYTYNTYALTPGAWGMYFMRMKDNNYTGGTNSRGTELNWNTTSTPGDGITVSICYEVAASHNSGGYCLWTLTAAQVGYGLAFHLMPAVTN